MLYLLRDILEQLNLGVLAQLRTCYCFHKSYRSDKTPSPAVCGLWSGEASSGFSLLPLLDDVREPLVDFVGFI